jgi:hypothetical protein
MPAFGMRLFVPSPRETNVLVLLGCAALGYGLYLRYLVIDAPALEAACATGLPRAVCDLRRFAIDLYELQFFGGVALVAAIVHLVRPRLATFTIGLMTAIFGLVLSNNELSALAIGLLVMGFARPRAASRRAPARAIRPQTRAPASSKTSR